MHANKRLVTEMLRNRFGMLGGYVGSDMENVKQLTTNYQFAKTDETGVKLAMEAGLDQDMGGQYVTYTKGMIESGYLSNVRQSASTPNPPQQTNSAPWRCHRYTSSRRHLRKIYCGVLFSDGIPEYTHA